MFLGKRLCLVIISRVVDIRVIVGAHWQVSLINACAHVPYIILIYTYAVLRTALIRAILLVCLIFALKSSKIMVLIFSKLQRKCIFSCIFFQKYLVSSKKSSTFASAFAQNLGSPQKTRAMIFEKMSIITRL